MSFEKVRAYFETRGMGERVLTFEVSSATVELAALAVGVEGARIAKTLAFALGGGCTLIVAAGDAKIANAKFKAYFHAKAAMPGPQEVLAMTGHAVGGVCPFAVDPGIPVYLDVSLGRFDMVYPACGSGNSAIGLTPAELFQHAGARAWVDVCKGWREEC